MLSGNNEITSSELLSELNNTLPDDSAYSISVLDKNPTSGIYVLEVKPNSSGEFKKS